MFSKISWFRLVASGAILGGLIGVGHVFFKPRDVSAAPTLPKPSYVNSQQMLKQIPIVKNKILTANHNYTNLHGSVTIKNVSAGTTSEDQVWLVQPDKFKLIFTPNTSYPNQTLVAVNNGSKVQIQNLNGTISDYKPIQAPKNPATPTSNVVVPNLNGTFLPFGGINEMLHPEMFEQSIFRFGGLTVHGQSTYIGRPVTLIDIHLTNSKLGDEQKFWIDNSTGVVLKTVIYKQGSPLEEYAFTSIDFNSINSSVFNLIAPNK